MRTRRRKFLQKFYFAWVSEIGGATGLSCRTMILTNFRRAFLVRTAVLTGCLLGLSSLAAQTPRYFPLEVGNTWLYRAVSINPSAQGKLDFRYQSIQVLGTEKIGDREY